MTGREKAESEKQPREGRKDSRGGQKASRTKSGDDATTGLSQEKRFKVLVWCHLETPDGLECKTHAESN